LVAQAVPQLMSINEADLFEAGEERAVTELMKARLGKLVVSLPDLDFIERQINGIAFETVL
jgi:hypothetical protein